MMVDREAPVEGPTIGTYRAYRRYLFAVALGFGATLLVWIVLAALQLGATTPSSAWTDEIYRLKEARLRSVEGPTLVIVGGSSILFGLSAETMDRELGLPVVNFGTHAGLGLTYILYRARQVLEPGDTVLLLLEYSLFIEPAQPSKVLVDYVLARDPGYLWSLGWFERLRFLMAVTPARLGEGLASRLGISDSLSPSIRYDSENLNAFGDETSHFPEDRRVDLISLSPVNGLSVERPVTPAASGWESLGSFLEWAEAEGITVVPTFPPTLYFREYEAAATRASVDEIVGFYRGHGLEVLGDPWTFMYDLELMFDSPYHLTTVGMAANTETTVSLLCSNERLAARLCSGASP